MSRIKTYWAYFLYVYIIRWESATILSIDIFILISAIIAAFMINNFVLTIAIIYLGLKLLYKANSIIKNLRHHFGMKQKLSMESAHTLMRRGRGEFRFVDILPCEHDHEQGFQVDLFDDHDLQQPIFRSPELDKRLRMGKDFTLIENDQKLKDLREIIRRDDDKFLYILRHHTAKAISNRTMFFNEKKFCISGDFDFTNHTISYHKGTYFDSLLTNFLYDKIVKEGYRNETRVYLDGTAHFPILCSNDGKNSLLSISQSYVNNHVGVSTIAFTDDGYMVIFRQGKDTKIDSNLLVATGNGSCDWKDRRDNSLINTVKYAMERELKEEGYLNNDYNMSTMILGFFRWVRFSGKPQFVGITRIRGVKYEAIRAQEGKKIDDEIDGYVLKQEKLLELVESLLARKDLSMGLAIGLASILECINRDEKQIIDFLYPFNC